MKKVITIVVVLLMTLLITGCGDGKSKLVCTSKNEYNVSETIFTISYENGNLKTVEIETVVDFSKVTDLKSIGCGNTIEDCMNGVREELNVEKGQKIYDTYKITDETSTGLKVYKTYSEKYLTNENEKKLNYYTTKEKAEKLMESMGYSCK